MTSTCSDNCKSKHNFIFCGRIYCIAFHWWLISTEVDAFPRRKFRVRSQNEATQVTGSSTGLTREGKSKTLCILQRNRGRLDDWHSGSIEDSPTVRAHAHWICRTSLVLKTNECQQEMRAQSCFTLTSAFTAGQMDARDLWAMKQAAPSSLLLR